MKSTERVYWYYLLIAALLFFDQISKNYFLEKQFVSISSWFNFELSFNTGSAFSLAIPIGVTIFIGVILGIGLFFWPLFKKFNQLAIVEQALIGIVAAGVIGNTIDRVVYLKVIDFIKIGWWPVFNLADTYLTVGVTVLIGYHIFRPSK